mgnify:CR=1 FL=1
MGIRNEISRRGNIDEMESIMEVSPGKKKKRLIRFSSNEMPGLIPSF